MAISETLTLDLKPALASVTILNKQITEATKPRTVDVKANVEDGGGIARMNTGLQTATGHTNTLRNAVVGVSVAFAAVGAAVGIALVKIGEFGLQAAGQFQQTQIAFEGILGSADAAGKMLDDLRAFAAKTPFEFPELATAAKQLLAVGFNAEDVIPIMTKLGNVAATLGVGGEAINGVVRALGQMQGKGKASAEELQQISEQIPGFSAIGAIAQSMGISVAEAFALMEQGAIPADQAIQAILAGMERFPGAAGAMERQSKTLLGVWSTLKDTFRDALIDGIEPLLPALSAALVGITPVLQGLIGSLAGTFGTLFESIGPLLQGGLAVLTPVFEALKNVFVALQPALNVVAHLFNALAESGALDALGKAAVSIAEGFSQIVVALGPSLEKITIGLTKFLAVVGKDLGKILKAVGPDIGKLGEQFTVLAIAILEGILPILPDLTKLLILVLPPLITLMRINMQPLIIQAKLFGIAMQGLHDAIKFVGDVIDRFDFGVLLDNIEGAGADILAFFTGFPDMVVDALGDLGATIWNNLAAGFEFLKTQLISAVDAYVGFYLAFPGRVLGALGDLGATIWNNLVGGFEFLKTQISAVTDAIVGFFTSIPERVGDIGEAIIGPAKAAYNAFARFVNGIEFTAPSVDTHIPGVGHIGGFTIGFPDLPIIHSGGIVPGIPGSDVLALLQAGELVVSRQQLRSMQSGDQTIVFNIEVHGVHDPAAARQVGREIGEGAMSALTRRRISVAARTGSVG